MSTALLAPELGVRLDDLRLDRLAVDDQEVAEHLYRVAEGLLDDEADPLGAPALPLGRAHRLREALRSLDVGTPDGRLPAALDDALSEAEWAEQHRHDGARAWTFGPRLVLQAPWTLSLHRRLHDLGAGAEWSRELQGWVLDGLDEHDVELTELVERYELAPSPGAERTLDGRAGWQEHLDAAVGSATGRGFVLPGSFPSGRQLRPWQESGVLALASQGATLLADQVGLGKGGQFTCGAIALSQWLAEHDPDHDVWPVVVSVTKSMVGEIVEEIGRWKADAKIQLLRGTTATPVEEGVEFVVLNHDILNKRLEDLLEAAPRGFVADEAHYFKNPDAKRTQAAKELAVQVRDNAEHPYVVLATGTPFTSRPSELWSVFEILGQDKTVGRFAAEKPRRRRPAGPRPDQARLAEDADVAAAGLRDPATARATTTSTARGQNDGGEQPRGAEPAADRAGHGSPPEVRRHRAAAAADRAHPPAAARRGRDGRVPTAPSASSATGWPSGSSRPPARRASARSTPCGCCWPSWPRASR